MLRCPLSHSLVSDPGKAPAAQVCLGAAVALAAAPAAVRLLGARGLPRAAVLWAAWAAPRGALAAAAALSLLRAAALVAHYGAPMAVYRRLPEVRRRGARASAHARHTMLAGVFIRYTA